MAKQKVYDRCAKSLDPKLDEQCKRSTSSDSQEDKAISATDKRNRKRTSSKRKVKDSQTTDRDFIYAFGSSSDEDIHIKVRKRDDDDGDYTPSPKKKKKKEMALEAVDDNNKGNDGSIVKDTTTKDCKKYAIKITSQQNNGNCEPIVTAEDQETKLMTEREDELVTKLSDKSFILDNTGLKKNDGKSLPLGGKSIQGHTKKIRKESGKKKEQNLKGKLDRDSCRKSKEKEDSFKKHDSIAVEMKGFDLPKEDMVQKSYDKKTNDGVEVVSFSRSGEDSNHHSLPLELFLKSSEKKIINKELSNVEYSFAQDKLTTCVVSRSVEPDNKLVESFASIPEDPNEKSNANKSKTKNHKLCKPVGSNSRGKNSRYVKKTSAIVDVNIARNITSKEHTKGDNKNKMKKTGITNSSEMTDSLSSKLDPQKINGKSAPIAGLSPLRSNAKVNTDNNSTEQISILNVKTDKIFIVKNSVEISSSEINNNEEDTNSIGESQEKCEKKDFDSLSRLRKQRCKICNVVYNKNGFTMHYRKCKKYENWKCETCDTKNVHQFTPHLPYSGPNGPGTLCPPCGRKYESEVRKKNKNYFESGTDEKEYSFKKRCPVCNEFFVKNGFAMHFKKCTKYEKWQCEFCNLKGIHSFTPRLPFPGPNGPGTLCPPCGRKYEKRAKLKEKLSLTNEQKSSTIFEKKIISNKNKDSSTSIPADLIKTNTSIPENIKIEDCSNVNEKGDILNKNGETVIRLKGNEFSTSASVHHVKDNTVIPKNIQVLHDLDNIGNTMNDVNVCNDTCNNLSDLHELAMMHSALKDPARLIQDGPGTWMVTDQMSKDYISEEMIINHWITMLQRKQNKYTSNLTSVPVKYCATLVLITCLASTNPQAQSVALLKDGWVPVFNFQLSEKASKKLRRKSTRNVCKKKDYLQGKWYNTSVSEDIPCEESALTLQEAWEKNTNILKKHIEKKLISEVEKCAAKELSGKSTKEYSTKKLSTKEKEVTEISLGDKSNALDHKSKSNLRQDCQGIKIQNTKNDEFNNDKIIPKHIVTMMKKRSTYVTKGDPRPCFSCSWCGPKSLHGQSNDDKEPCCDACRILFHEGWRKRWTENEEKENAEIESPLIAKVRPNWYNFQFSNENGNLVRSVKSLLTSSTDHVVERLNEINSKGTKCVDHQFEHTETSSLSKIKVRKKQNKACNEDNLSISEIHKETNETSQSSLIENAHFIKCKKEVKPEVDGEELLPCKTQSDLNTCSQVVEKKANVEKCINLPKISQLYKSNGGLSKTLQDDRICLLNAFHGSDALISVKVLQCLQSGELPFPVQFEIPFLRPQTEFRKFSNTCDPQPTKYFGVTRITNPNGIIAKDLDEPTLKHSISRFGVEFPAFDRDHLFFENGETLPYQNRLNNKPNSFFLPKCATIGGTKLLVRADIQCEDVAGKLYAFMYRIMYGSDTTDALRARTNDTFAFKEDTIHSNFVF